MESDPSIPALAVPGELLAYCEGKRRDALVSAVQKATNLYRRVSGVNYKSPHDAERRTKRKHNGSKCLVCLVTLVKSSKDRRKAGVKLRCPCDARVCFTCFANNPQWYLTEPHFSKCPTLPGFVCSVCFVFHRVKEKVCCAWMCPGCSSDRRVGSCEECSRVLDGRSRRETRHLWPKPKSPRDSGGESESVPDGDKVARYREEIRLRVLDEVSDERHLSASGLRALFHECFAPRPCTCGTDQNPLCISCTPVLTLMELLARNPRPLVASLSERAIPGRALARHVYNRALLLEMLNDPDLPPCVNGRSCKGALLTAPHGARPLPSLIPPQTYDRLVSAKAEGREEFQRASACCCIVCLLFNQSAAITRMLGSESLYLEPHPGGPVYYFNVKLSPDVGIPEVAIDDYQGYLVNFRGSVGSYKPTFYYSWRDMLQVLGVDKSGRVTISPSGSPSVQPGFAFAAVERGDVKPEPLLPRS